MNIKTSLGWISLELGARGVKSVCFGKKNFSDELFKESHFISDWLKRYAEGKAASAFPWKWLDLSERTAFEKKVYRQLWLIPHGSTRSYRGIAQKIGQPKAARAVGQANGRNPIPILIPCHRVIAADGSLGGFSCGLKIKKKLLALEGTQNG